MLDDAPALVFVDSIVPPALTLQAGWNIKPDVTLQKPRAKYSASTLLSSLLRQRLLL